MIITVYRSHYLYNAKLDKQNGFGSTATPYINLIYTQ